MCVRPFFIGKIQSCLFFSLDINQRLWFFFLFGCYHRKSIWFGNTLFQKLIRSENFIHVTMKAYVRTTMRAEQLFIFFKWLLSWVYTEKQVRRFLQRSTTYVVSKAWRKKRPPSLHWLLESKGKSDFIAISICNWQRNNLNSFNNFCVWETILAEQVESLINLKRKRRLFSKDLLFLVY